MTKITRYFEDLHDRWTDRNSRIKVAKIKRVFAREGGLIDGELSSDKPNRLVCNHPGRCATGALLAAAGVEDHVLQFRLSANFEQRALLKRVYGLSYGEVHSLMASNDSDTLKGAWIRCGIKWRPENEVRVCVVNGAIENLADHGVSF